MCVLLQASGSGHPFGGRQSSVPSAEMTEGISVINYSIFLLDNQGERGEEASIVSFSGVRRTVGQVGNRSCGSVCGSFSFLSESGNCRSVKEHPERHGCARWTSLGVSGDFSGADGNRPQGRQRV